MQNKKNLKGKINYISLFILLNLLLSACSVTKVEILPSIPPSPQTTPLETTPESVQITPIQTKTAPMPTDTPIDRNIPIPNYQLTVRYDYIAQTAQIDEIINYTNPSDTPLTDIKLAVDPLRYKDSFLLESIKINQSEFTEFELGKSWINLPLAKTLLPGEALQLELSFTLIMPSIANPQPDQKPGIFGYTVLQTNFVDWYPFIPPLTEEGIWQIHDAWFFGEYLVYDLADFSVEINLENAPQNSIIAACATPSSSKPNQYTYEHKAARNFVWSFSPSFIVKTDNVNGIEVSSYYFSFHQKAGEQALIETAKAIALYEELFGPYPHKNLAIVEADFLDGMEYDGLYFLSKGFYNLYDGTPQGYLTMIAVHETAHQWWYTKVANDQALEPWLDEALCTYTEYIFYEALYPEFADWWWEYRVNYYQPSGKIDLPIYDYPGFTPYRDATYLQGAKFLHQLRSQMGDEQFFAFLKTYAAMYDGKISSTALFWQFVERITSQDQTDLMDEFFQESYQISPQN
jgi:hypothetical protein